MSIAAETPVVPKVNLLNRLLAMVPPALWSVIVLVVVWELAVKVAEIPNYVLPAPSAILVEFGAYWHRLLPNAMVTAGEVVFGFLCAVLIGVPLSVFITYSRFMERSIYPLIVASQTVPKVAIAPLLLTWFGYGLAPKIVIVVLLSFFPIVINSVMGLKSASREMIYLARSMGASGWQQFWKFRLPQALPSMFAGFKLATVLSVIGAIVAEFIGADKGLGYLILVAGSSFNITRQFAAIILITIIGIVFFMVIERLERVVIPWRHRGPSETDA
ncbi:ABC transporter permease [Kaistia dalseonensis]|uniref:NitT/TauT family transport system permease protein n=1 Tax=Kaistia dalseonensis TaxID=410840 RepID=A0ABU0H2S5_9HYPH|nr:ABC transporter permease [Kaistia dalseonensis]MCX5494034.1 ABC transporter permease [Kaistia dalseonensis]MDQ0436612.1 NitT/TauT family transport system permease protein [Kaistia dalseonensis]